MDSSHHLEIGTAVRRSAVAFSIALVAAFATQAGAQVTIYDLTAQWSDAANPNGVWTYREGTNALPAVASWQASLGGWASPQPGWARSQDSNNRLPFWFKSNGSETFVHDYLAGDVVIHSLDPINGVGNDHGNVVWTSPAAGVADVSGAVWLGRDIGRAVDWSLLINGVTVTGGSLSDGDAFNRASPFQLSAGSGGAGAIANLPVAAGSQIELRFITQGIAGDFVGVDFAVDLAVPEPTTMMLAAGTLATLLISRRRR